MSAVKRKKVKRKVKRKKVKRKVKRRVKRKVKRKKVKRKVKRRVKRKKETRDVFKDIKKSLSDIGDSLSEGADKIADLLLESGEKEKNAKVKKLKKQLVSTLEDIASGIKRSLGNVTPKDILCETSYEIGRLSRITRDKFVEIFDRLAK
jgi:dGTP triphosphohydrolase